MEVSFRLRDSRIEGTVPYIVAGLQHRNTLLSQFEYLTWQRTSVALFPCSFPFNPYATLTVQPPHLSTCHICYSFNLCRRTLVHEYLLWNVGSRMFALYPVRWVLQRTLFLLHQFVDQVRLWASSVTCSATAFAPTSREAWALYSFYGFQKSFKPKSIALRSARISLLDQVGEIVELPVNHFKFPPDSQDERAQFI